MPHMKLGVDYAKVMRRVYMLGRLPGTYSQEGVSNEHISKYEWGKEASFLLKHQQGRHEASHTFYSSIEGGAIIRSQTGCFQCNKTL